MAPGWERRIAGLDGLRALACLAVMAFHAHVPGFSRGWLGVDVFFVLAGFLTVQQLGRPGARPGLWIYRRWARLHPALLVMVVLVGPVAVVGGADVRVPIAAGAFLYWPWIAGGPGGLFGHVWSITVEMCSYAVAACAVSPVLRRRNLKVPLGVALAIVAVLMLMLPWGWLDVARPYGFVLGMSIGLLPLGPALTVLRPMGRILGTPLLAVVGLRTYSLYLWHLPIFLLLANHSAFSGIALMVLQFSLVGIVGELSYRFVEGPPRRFLYARATLWWPAGSTEARHGTSSLIP